MKIYLDSCCLNRPFDDLRDDAVRMEAEAVMAIIDRCESGEWVFYASDVLFDEIDNTPDLNRKQKILILYRSATGHIDLTAEIIARAKELERFNVKAYDALHLASAEAEAVDIFLTTDRRLLNAATRSDTTINVKNPLLWLTKELYDGHQS
jgi:predicted nucleic acid-binding protein